MYYSSHSLKYCTPYACFSKLKSNILTGLAEDYAFPFKLIIFKNKQERKQVWGLPAWRETHWREQHPHTNFGGGWDFCHWLFSIRLWTAEAKGAGWWSAPVQSMLGNCQDYNGPLLVGLAAMPRAEWATETALVMTAAGPSWTTRALPPHRPATRADSRHVEMLRFLPHQDAVPSGWRKISTSRWSV